MNDDENINLSFPSPSNDHDQPNASNEEDNPALKLIRQKIKNILEEEPSANRELTEIKHEKSPLSKHQKFISDLKEAGTSLPEIQKEWHKYYLSLSDKEKNEVWQEFYSAHKQPAPPKSPTPPTKPSSYLPLQNGERGKPSVTTITEEPKPTRRPSISPKTTAQLKHQLLTKVQEHQATVSKLKRGGHSLAFGLSMGFFVILVFLFSFFNDRFIAPFITPSRTVSADSIILDPNSADIGPNPVIIIPKINVEIPVVYNASSIDSNTIENALEDGVVHYPTTPDPGQTGNGVIFGHSSNNILNPGKYKFAFVLLHDLVDGDTFYLAYNSKLYVYQVYETEVVNPNDTNVLTTQNYPATFTLITCDPPGTSINRLIVFGKQISPDPSADASSSVNQNNAPKPDELPSNSPSLWSRISQTI